MTSRLGTGILKSFIYGVANRTIVEIIGIYPKSVYERVSEVSRKNKKEGVIIPDDNIT